jgi:hypothetical protein
MIKIERDVIDGFETAFRGMRNPLNSWKNSDSKFGAIFEDDYLDLVNDFIHSNFEVNDDDKMYELRNKYDFQAYLDSAGEKQNITMYALLGPKDLELAKKLILSGSDHSKFLRQINVSMDIDAPLYWWKEMDTYKVGTVANSCSTMHKLASTPITVDCFSFDNKTLEDYEEYQGDYTVLQMQEEIVKNCEQLRQYLSFKETSNVGYWRALVQLLPASWNQKRTWTTNYAVLRNIYFARQNHKLSEWQTFCKRIELMPYAEDLICLKK